MCLPLFFTLGDVQRLYDFIRRHPTGVDTFWAVVLLGLSLLWVGSSDPESGNLVGYGVVSALYSLVVALRRRAPRRCCSSRSASGSRSSASA